MSQPSELSDDNQALDVLREFAARPERRLIRLQGSARHIDFVVRVGEVPTSQTRPSLRLALVLDRSGSMSGEKIETAKQTAAALVERLEERDQVAMVIFDDQIDILQSAAHVSSAVKRQLRAAIGSLQARASTALHEGWLTGCKTLTDSDPDAGLARCLLLTDGLANVGITDPERIATEAASVRAHTGIGTSTFGIGPDYDEALLGPMAIAGGGQFHHLRTAAEIGQTFAGELGELFAVAATRVRLEIALDPGIRPQMVSQYSLRRAEEARDNWISEIGDLIRGEERHIVVRFSFPLGSVQDECVVRARLHWSATGHEHITDWAECHFTYATDDECDREIEHADYAVLHWVGLHHADRARFEAAALNQRGNLQEARRCVARVAERIAQYAGNDQDLLATLADLRSLELQVAEAPMASMAAKEMAFQSLRSSRGQRDYRRQ